MERVIEIEHTTFTPLVFGTNGGMGRECGLFIKNLAMKLAEKENEQYSDVTVHSSFFPTFDFLKICCFLHCIQPVNPIFMLPYIIMDLTIYVITLLRTKLSFCILRAALLCVRGSRTPWRKNYRMKQEETDFALLNKEADIFKIIFPLILFICLFFLALRHFIRLFYGHFLSCNCSILEIN